MNKQTYNNLINRMGQVLHKTSPVYFAVCNEIAKEYQENYNNE